MVTSSQVKELSPVRVGLRQLRAKQNQTREIKPTQETLLQNFYIIYF